MRRLINDITISLIFLTRLPVRWSGDMPRARITQAMRAFPIAGALTGAISGGVFWLAVTLGLGGWIAAVLAVGALLLTTGAFHEDGLADMADGFGGGQSRPRKLEIMLDSRLGTYGAAALFCALSLKMAALTGIGAGETVFRTLIASGALSRAVIVVVMWSTPAAREDGQAASAGQPSETGALQGVLIASVIAVLSMPLVFVPAMMLAAVLSGAGVAALARRQIGGQTGDVLGASQVISELAMLLAVKALLAV